MRIGMVLRSFFPPDIRVLKEATALRRDGHAVFLLALGRDGEPRRERIGPILVDRVPEPAPFRRRLDWLRFHSRFRSGWWAHRLARFIARFRIQALHIHDLPLLGTALAVAPHLPVVADLHEHYPAAVELWSAGSRNPLEWFTEDRRRWERYERRTLSRAAHVIVVVEEAQRRIVAQCGVPAERVTVVGNTEDAAAFVASGAPVPPAPGFRLLYVGGVRPHRGLDTAVRALAWLDHLPDVRLVVVGSRDDDARALEALARRLGVGGRFEVLGWQPLEAIPDLIRTAMVGLVPHHRNDHTDATIPHKLFQYMLMERPVLVSDCTPLRRIVEETDAGCVFRAGDPQDFARQVERMHADATAREGWGRHGHRAAQGRYGWSRDAARLLALYTGLA